MFPKTTPLTYRQLRVALLANAAFSFLSGLLFVAFASAIAHRVGDAISPVLIGAVGILLVPFGGLTAWVGTRRHPPTWIALLISLSDLAWVVASAVVIAVWRERLTFEGVVLLSAIALAVSGFAAGQLRGITRVYRVAGANADRVRVCIEIQTAGDPDFIWRNLSDLGNIAQFAPMLSKSLLHGKGAVAVGAVRECVDRAGREWRERCVRFEPAKRELEMEFLADRPGFPYPFAALRGGWEVHPAAAGITVKIWWEGTLKYPQLTAVIPPLLAWQVRRQFSDVVRRMAGHKVEGPPSAAPRLRVVPC